MTLYRNSFNRTACTKSRFLELLQVNGTPFDFRPLFVSKLVVSRNVDGLLPGKRHRCHYIYDINHPLEK